MRLLLTLIVRKESNAELMTQNWFIDSEQCLTLWYRQIGNQTQSICILLLCTCILHVFFLYVNMPKGQMRQIKEARLTHHHRHRRHAPWLFRMRRMYVKAIVFHIDLIFHFVSWLYFCFFFSRIVLLSKCRAPKFLNGNEFWYKNACIIGAMVSVEFTQFNEQQLFA